MSCQLMCGVRFIPAPHIPERYSERYKSLHSSVSSADFVLMLMRERVFSTAEKDAGPRYQTLNRHKHVNSTS